MAFRDPDDIPAPQDCRTLWADAATGYVVQRPSALGRWSHVIRHGDTASSAVDPAERLAIMAPSQPGTPDRSLEHLWLDQLLPALLDFDGVLTLHAGAVDLDGAGVIFMGRSGAGKSTLTASLASARTPALNDDGVVVTVDEAGFAVAPIYPGLRLLPDSRARLVPDSVETSFVSHYAWKERIHLADGLSAGPVRLSAIFLLGAASEVKVRPLAPALACMRLVEQSFALDPTDPVRAKARLAQAAAVASRVPAFALDYPRDYARLPEVHAALFAAAKGPAART